jgi:hypothetical protein
MPQQEGMPDMRTLNRTISFVYIFLGPVFMACFLLIASALAHVMLTILGQSKHGFSATFRALCYSCAPFFLGVLPFCGALVGGVWNLVLEVIGISTLQSTSIGHAIAAVLAPVILGCCCAFGLAAMAGMMSGLQGAMP